MCDFYVIIFLFNNDIISWRIKIWKKCKKDFKEKFIKNCIKNMAKQKHFHCLTCAFRYSLAGNVMRNRKCFNDKNPAEKYRKRPSSPRNSYIRMRRIHRQKCNSCQNVCRFRSLRPLSHSRVYLSSKGRPWQNNAFNFTVLFKCALLTPQVILQSWLLTRC